MKPTQKQIREIQEAAKSKLEEAAEAATPEARQAAEAEFDALMDKADRLAALRERHERLAKLHDSVEESRDVREEGGKLTRAQYRQRKRIAERYIRRGRTAVSDEEYRQLHQLDERETAFFEWLCTQRSNVENVQTPEQRRLNAVLGKQERALTTGIAAAPAAGYTIPEGFMAEIIADMSAYGPMADFGFVRRITTTSGNDLPLPLEHAGATAKATIVSEGVKFADVDPSFGPLVMDAYKYGTRQELSVELLEDTGVGLEEYIRMFNAEAFGRALNEHFTVGDGSGKPHGLTTVRLAASGRRDTDTGLAADAQTVNVNDMTDDIIVADDLMDLTMLGIDPAYQMNSCLMVHNTVRARMRKFKGSDGQYLWLRDVREGAGEMFNGIPVKINQALSADGSASTNVGIVMDPMSYMVRQVGSMTMDRSDQEEFSKDLVVLKARWRMDGAPIRPRGIAVLRTQA